jgi:hypothetical protein
MNRGEQRSVNKNKTTGAATDKIGFVEARNLFISKGAWVLPFPTTRDKFSSLALATFKEFEKIDCVGVFAEPVSDSDARDYSVIMANPIDLATMKTKLDN